MEARVTIAAIIALCIAIVIVAYILGVEVGRAQMLQLHPGYEATRASLQRRPAQAPGARI